MDLLFKAIAGAMIAVILGQVVSRQNKETAMLLVTAVCCMIAAASTIYLQPVVDFFGRLQNLGNLDPEILGILMKAIGIGILSEIAANVCADAGNSALSKTLQLLATAVIIWLSLPLFSKLIELIERTMQTL